MQMQILGGSTFAGVTGKVTKLINSGHIPLQHAAAAIRYNLIQE